MKDKILGELKPVLKTIADMQFFTYKKIKNIENSFLKIKDKWPKRSINNTSDNILEIAGFDDNWEIDKLTSINNMPEVDDLTNFGIGSKTENKKNSINNIGVKNIIPINHKQKPKKNERSILNNLLPKDTVVDMSELENKLKKDANFSNKKFLKKNMFNDP